MNLFEALKETGFATMKHSPDEKYFVRENTLYYSHNGNELKSILSAQAAFSYDWVPYKTPCKHDPKMWNPRLKYFEMKCSYCGVNLKATGWEEV